MHCSSASVPSHGRRPWHLWMVSGEKHPSIDLELPQPRHDRISPANPAVALPFELEFLATSGQRALFLVPYPPIPGKLVEMSGEQMTMNRTGTT